MANVDANAPAVNNRLTICPLPSMLPVLDCHNIVAQSGAYDPAEIGMGHQPFRATVRYFRPEKKAGLAVLDIPKDVAADLGGLKQMRVRGTLNGVAFNSNVMPAGGGVLALSLSQTILGAAGLKVGDSARVDLERI